MFEEEEQQLPDTVDVRSLVFDDQNQERRSWKFCNYSVPRSEVVFICQVSIIFFMIVFACINLYLSKKCEDTTIWVAILSSAVGYILPNPKL